MIATGDRVSAAGEAFANSVSAIRVNVIYRSGERAHRYVLNNSSRQWWWSSRLTRKEPQQISGNMGEEQAGVDATDVVRATRRVPPIVRSQIVPRPCRKDVPGVIREGVKPAALT
jgi:hypothetical protein